MKNLINRQTTTYPLSPMARRRLLHAVALFYFFALMICFPAWTQATNGLKDERPVDTQSSLLEREAIVRQTLDQLHREAYDSVFANSLRLRERAPDDPVGYFLAADAYNTMMRDYRIRRFEAPFDSLIHLTIHRAKEAIKERPSAENYFLLGSAEGYRCLHLFRRGQWFKAIKSAVNSVDHLSRARDMDPDFVDPLLGLALYDYGKSKVPALGLFVSRKDVIRRLERVRQEGRYVSISALYALQIVYFETERTEEAWKVNEALYLHFPDNPVCLYNRALLLEEMRRRQEAAEVWRRLIARVETSVQPGNGYLAECYYHLYLLEKEAGEIDHARKSLETAIRYVRAYREQDEMDGPYVSFKNIREAIEREENRE
jgi:tetratricopeptide (TPR) repeat protein